MAPKAPMTIALPQFTLPKSPPLDIRSPPTLPAKPNIPPEIIEPATPTPEPPIRPEMPPISPSKPACHQFILSHPLVIPCDTTLPPKPTAAPTKKPMSSNEIATCPLGSTFIIGLFRQ